MNSLTDFERHVEWLEQGRVPAPHKDVGSAADALAGQIVAVPWRTEQELSWAHRLVLRLDRLRKPKRG